MIPEKEQSQLNKGICLPKENAFQPAARAYKTGPDLLGEESDPKEQCLCARWILQQQLDTFLTGWDRNLECFCGLVPERAECWRGSIFAVLRRPRSPTGINQHSTQEASVLVPKNLLHAGVTEFG